MYIYIMSLPKGFLGDIIVDCFTSGLTGVYFKMIFKNSKANESLYWNSNKENTWHTLKTWDKSSTKKIVQ